jgi:hypothetical protein
MAAVMCVDFGVIYHPGHISRVCKALCWSPPKILHGARQRDEAAMARWRADTWPATNKGRRPSSQRSSFVDESGFYPLPSVVRTSAPIGQTPMLREWRTREHLSAISEISPEGQLYCHGQEGAIDSADRVAFLEHLRREVPARMVVIWDGAPRHRRHLSKDFLENRAAQRLPLERLPADAPERDPDEGIWQQLKGVEWRHLCCFDLRHLWHALRTAVTRVRRQPRILKGCFAGAGL